MQMHNPSHPGEAIRELCLEPMGLTVTKAARGLGVTRKALSELLNGHSGISPEMAIRLSKAFGGSAVAVRETPAILGEVNAEALLRDILDELHDLGQSAQLRERIDAILSRVACHGSIRSGRRMQAEEMNALLREMEATPHSGQCNHGRPTYVELKLSDIERLFGRT